MLKQQHQNTALEDFPVSAPPEFVQCVFLLLIAVFSLCSFFILLMVLFSMQLFTLSLDSGKLLAFIMPLGIHRNS